MCCGGRSATVWTAKPPSAGNGSRKSLMKLTPHHLPELQDNLHPQKAAATVL
jgi:hypothetical protein